MCILQQLCDLGPWKEPSITSRLPLVLTWMQPFHNGILCQVFECLTNNWHDSNLVHEHLNLQCMESPRIRAVILRCHCLFHCKDSQLLRQLYLHRVFDFVDTGYWERLRWRVWQITTNSDLQLDHRFVQFRIMDLIVCCHLQCRFRQDSSSQCKSLCL
jgi:hypothetical protein